MIEYSIGLHPGQYRCPVVRKRQRQIRRGNRRDRQRCEKEPLQDRPSLRPIISHGETPVPIRPYPLLLGLHVVAQREEAVGSAVDEALAAVDALVVVDQDEEVIEQVERVHRTWRFVDHSEAG